MLGEQIICQSCGMPLKDKIHRGSNADGSESLEYCKYCYEQGAFTDGCTNLEEKAKQCIDAAVAGGLPKKSAEDMAKAILPRLKRWN
ncbi:MAG: zinc ribbon domain-containing protein [Flavobacteriales bacterium]|nr:zinc ribbon domain-containing protein [Flavobacteriales bacterium]